MLILLCQAVENKRKTLSGIGFQKKIDMKPNVNSTFLISGIIVVFTVILARFTQKPYYFILPAILSPAALSNSTSQLGCSCTTEAGISVVTGPTIAFSMISAL